VLSFLVLRLGSSMGVLLGMIATASFWGVTSVLELPLQTVMAYHM